MTNTGTIYVFENAASENCDENCFLLKAVGHTINTDVEKEDITTLQRRTPLTRGSRYGNALLNLGNWKGGRSEAFAVGAPFEDNGKGAGASSSTPRRPAPRGPTTQKQRGGGSAK